MKSNKFEKTLDPIKTKKTPQKQIYLERNINKDAME
jgi:hypothetical protein